MILCFSEMEGRKEVKERKEGKIDKETAVID